MDEFEQSDLEKQIDHLQAQNVIHYKERENAFMKKVRNVVYFLLSWL